MGEGDFAGLQTGFVGDVALCCEGQPDWCFAVVFF